MFISNFACKMYMIVLEDKKKEVFNLIQSKLEENRSGKQVLFSVGNRKQQVKFSFRNTL